ncbi:hypothetical protein ODQ43_17925, partial [Escherichia coli]|nr:hypothetical protein [Escherichia coli]
QDDKGWDARKRAYCLKIQPATGSFARNLIYSTKPVWIYDFKTQLIYIFKIMQLQAQLNYSRATKNPKKKSTFTVGFFYICN